VGRGQAGPPLQFQEETFERELAGRPRLAFVRP